MTAKFLDDIKDPGMHRMAFEGRMSFNLADVYRTGRKDAYFRKDAQPGSESLLNNLLWFHHEQRTLQSDHRYLDACERQADQYVDETIGRRRSGFNSIYRM